MLENVWIVSCCIDYDDGPTSFLEFFTADTIEGAKFCLDAVMKKQLKEIREYAEISPDPLTGLWEDASYRYIEGPDVTRFPRSVVGILQDGNETYFYCAVKAEDIQNIYGGRLADYLSAK